MRVSGATHRRRRPVKELVKSATFSRPSSNLLRDSNLFSLFLSFSLLIHRWLRPWATLPIFNFVTQPAAHAPSRVAFFVPFSITPSYTDSTLHIHLLFSFELSSSSNKISAISAPVFCKWKFLNWKWSGRSLCK